MVQALWNSPADSQKITKLPYDLAILHTHTHTPRKLKTYAHTKTPCTNVHSSIICNNQKVETIQMSINWWMDKQNMVCPHNRILLSHKSTSIHTTAPINLENINEFRHKRPIFLWLHFSETSKTGRCMETENTLMAAWGRGKGEQEVAANGPEVYFWGEDRALESHSANSCTPL